MKLLQFMETIYDYLSGPLKRSSLPCGSGVCVEALSLGYAQYECWICTNIDPQGS